MNDLTEEKIIEQFQQNNFKNFNIIYKKYYKKIYFFLLKMLKDDKLAEDISQEVFLDVISGINNLKNVDAFSSWIRKIALNKVNTIIKNKKNFSICSLNSICDLSSDYYLLEEIILKEECLSIVSEINKLPDSKGRAIVLYYFKELSLKEIALIENIPIGTVKSRLYSAKKLLKKSMSLKSN